VTARRRRQADYDAIKTASKLAVEKIGTVSLAASLTRALQPHLSKAISPNYPDSFLCADQQLDFEDIIGEPVITRVFADLAGYDLVARETKATGTDCEQFSSWASKAGVALEVCAKALEDGKVDGFEIPIVRKVLHELMDKVHAVDAALDAKQRGKVRIIRSPGLMTVEEMEVS
jgi:hypothetical protein